MSATNINVLLKLWAATLAVHKATPPFSSHTDLYERIDSTLLGDVRWRGTRLKYEGVLPQQNVPQWMTDEHEVWFRDPRQIVHNMLSNSDFEGEIDYAPFQEYDKDRNHRFQDFMSGNWAWNQCVSVVSHVNIFSDGNFQDLIAEDPDTHGSVFVPIILGSDKTTVSVGTGNNEYYPVYLSIGNIHNNVRRAHRNGLVLLGFLAIPKSELFSLILLNISQRDLAATKKHAHDVDFRKFRRQLYHSSLSRMLQSLKPYMTAPDVVRFPNGHFRRAIYGLGPYIADYPEQASLACIVQGWCPKYVLDYCS